MTFEAWLSHNYPAIVEEWQELDPEVPIAEYVSYGYPDIENRFYDGDTEGAWGWVNSMGDESGEVE